MSKKKKTFINISIALAVGSYILLKNLEIYLYNLWFMVFILIISLFPSLYAYFKNKVRGDRLFDYWLTVFCLCFTIYTVTEIIYLTKAPTKYYSSEVISIPRAGRRTTPGFTFNIDGHTIQYFIHVSGSTRDKFNTRKKDSTLFYAHGEYRNGFISAIQIKSFDLEIVKP